MSLCLTVCGRGAGEGETGTEIGFGSVMVFASLLSIGWGFGVIDLGGGPFNASNTSLAVGRLLGSYSKHLSMMRLTWGGKSLPVGISGFTPSLCSLMASPMARSGVSPLN